MTQHPSAYRRLVLASLAGTLAAGCAVALAATAAWLISRAAQHPPVLHLMVAVVAVRAFAIGRGVLRYVERLASHDAALRILAALRVTTYRDLERATDLTHRHGDLVARYVDDIDTLADRWVRLRLPYLSATIVGATAVALTALVLPAAAVILAATLLATALAAPALAGRHARRAQATISPLAGELNTHILTTLGNAAELTAGGHLPRTLATITTADTHLAAAERRAATGRGAATLLATASAGLAIVAILAVAATAVSTGDLDPVLLAAVTLPPIALHELYAALVPAATSLPRIRAAATRVRALRTPAEPAATTTLSTGRDLRIEGFTARGCQLPDITIPAGTAHVLTGPSGSGKSTLAAACLKLLRPDAGRVLLGGTDIADVDGDEVRRHVGWCAQDAHIFDSTIAANLRLANPQAGEDALWAALATARLADWVRELPHGLDTHVGEYGARLSGGQRQRLALTRVVLADFPIVILDEPTEHLDPATAAELLTDLLAACAGRTVLLITHGDPPPGLPVTVMSAADDFHFHPAPRNVASMVG